MDPIRVMLVDDHALMRAGLRDLFSRAHGMEVVAETGEATAVLPLVENLSPDVVLMDVALPGINGIQLAGEIARRHPNTRVLMLSMYDNAAYVLEALRHHASGYVLKDAEARDLVDAVRCVAAGGRYLSPSLDARTISSGLQEGPGHEPEGLLTERQRQVMRLIALGYKTAAIAQALGISPKTVDTHRAHLTHRLGIRSIAGLVRYAQEHGMLEVDAGANPESS